MASITAGTTSSSEHRPSATFVTRCAVGWQKQDAMATLEIAPPPQPSSPAHTTPRRGNQSENCEVIIWFASPSPLPRLCS